LDKAALGEARNRAGSGLDAARELYSSRLQRVSLALNVVEQEPIIRSALIKQDASGIVPLLRSISRQAQLDFAGIVAKDGRTLCRIGPNAIPKGGNPPNPIASLVLKNHVAAAGTVILESEFLFAEDPELARRAGIQQTAADQAIPGQQGAESSGMTLAAAAPVFENGRLLGALYGGILLNRSEEIANRICDVLFRREIYNNCSVGTAAIFHREAGISLSGFSSNGSRAGGIAVSQRVREQVLTQGRRWTDTVVLGNHRYVAAWDPIEDIFGRRAGMLCIGVLEAKYADARRGDLLTFLAITVAGMALALGLGCVAAHKISKPVRQLAEASLEASRGDPSPDIGITAKSEIGVLQTALRQMLAKDKRQKEESETRLLQSEKQASIGKLAGGVAHEINNPLTGVVTFTHMLLKRKDIPEDARSDLETIAQETERVRKIVKGLLDFSRQTELDREMTDMSRLVRHTVSLVENQALIKGVNLSLEQADGLPMITIDRNQIQSVLLNIIINALDATETGGSITITTGNKMRMSAGKAGQKGIEIAITDTGCGIPPEIMDKLFDPFFTTKEVGRGTGLGLSVSYGIVERHGGTILVQSKVQGGSTFFVWLPAEEQVAENENTDS
jgi:two-component system NtrC family sensor kinase